MATGLYQDRFNPGEGPGLWADRGNRWQEGMRFPTGDMPPMTMAEYLRFLETQKRTSSMPLDGTPSGLDAVNPSQPEGTTYKGLSNGIPAYTNIPERAQAMGLSDAMPPPPSGTSIEQIPGSGSSAMGPTMPDTTFSVSSGGEGIHPISSGRSYADRLQARQNLDKHIQEKNVPLAEALKMQQYWGVDNSSLEKAQKAEAETKKITSNVSANGFYMFNDGTESTIKAGAKPGASGASLTDEQAQVMGKATGMGRFNPKDIPARGQGRIQVLNAFLGEYPEGDTNKLTANIKKMQDPQSMRIITNTAPLIARVEQLEEKAKAMDPTAYPTINMAKNWLATQSGDPRVVDFNSLKTSIALEAARAMTGGVPTDIRFTTEMKQLDAANNIPQLAAAMSNLKNALHASSEGAVGLPYTWEDVRGEKSRAKTNTQSRVTATGGGKTITVKNPTTGEMETWDTTTKQRVK